MQRVRDERKNQLRRDVRVVPHFYSEYYSATPVLNSSASGLTRLGATASVQSEFTLSIYSDTAAIATGFEPIQVASLCSSL